MRVLLALALLVSAGCAEEDDGCPQYLQHAVYVATVDAVTGDRVPAAHVRFYEDGVLVDSCLPTDPVDEACVVYEAPATYDITVDAEGYESVAIERVVVVLNDSRCHPIPVDLLVELERAP